MRNTERLYDRVIEKMDMTCDMEDEELQELIHEVLEEASKEEFIPLQEKIRIIFFWKKRGVFLSQIADLCQLQSWKM